MTAVTKKIRSHDVPQRDSQIAVPLYRCETRSVLRQVGARIESFALTLATPDLPKSMETNAIQKSKL